MASRTIQPGPLVVFGEVLIDEFPDGQRVLGGAPFNVAWHLTAFGQATRLVSRIGTDADGERIRSAMSGWGMDLSCLQTDENRPTGLVSVKISEGQPTYDILANRAYDAIGPSEVAARECAALYHGTLALRSADSRLALEHLKSKSTAPVFMDVNLRDPWWDREQGLALADDASWVKLNAEELTRLIESNDNVHTLAERFLREHDLAGIIVTLGEEGAMALSGSGESARAAPRRGVEVVDTVGAGDAFAAVMLLGIVNEWPLQTSLMRAQEFASEIVRNRGAVLTERGAYDRLAAEWRS